MSTPFFAVFVVAETDGGFAATTRTDGRIGLPGGKVDAGETPQQAALREAREEGWSLPSDAPLALVHQQTVDGQQVAWFRTTATPRRLAVYKERNRGITPIVVSAHDVLGSGFGNENLNL